MRTVLRHSTTGLFFAGADCWTDNPAKARDFRLIDRALDFVEKFHLKDVRVVFTFRNGRSIFEVPPSCLEMDFVEKA
jgi:hypothetical protein